MSAHYECRGDTFLYYNPMRFKTLLATITFAFLSITTAKADLSCPTTPDKQEHRAIELADSLSPLISFHPWTPLLLPEPHPSSIRLSETDFIEAAAQLGVEVATIKAVVLVEAGHSEKGFDEPGMPIINFDLSLFKKFSRAKGIKLSKFQKSHPAVFAPLNRKKYGGIQQAQYARLNSAMEIDSVIAYEATFWGMFQIGGFNWKKCGCSSVDEYVRLMSRSEHDQLELFVRFILSRKLEGYLQAKNWAGFALRYNGKQYAKRGYPQRLARA